MSKSADTITRRKLSPSGRQMFARLSPINREMVANCWRLFGEMLANHTRVSRDARQIIAKRSPNVRQFSPIVRVGRQRRAS